MKSKFIVLFMLFSSMMYGQVKKVAILETVDKKGDLDYAVKLMLRSNLAKAITNTAGYEAYDRTDVDAIMGEQDFQRTGMVSDEQIKRLGEMTGADYILVAEAVIAGESNMFIAAKILNVESARTEKTDNILMGIAPSDVQTGCIELAERLFGISRQHNEETHSHENQRTVETGAVLDSQPGRCSNEYLTIDYPDNWKFAVTSDVNMTGSNSDESSAINIFVQRGVAMAPVPLTVKMLCQSLKRGNSDFNLISKNDKCIFAGLKGAMLEYTKDNFYYLQYILKDGGKMFIIVVTAELGRHQELATEANSILATINLLK